MRTLVLIALLGGALSASAAPSPLSKRERGKPSLEGEWKMTKNEYGFRAGSLTRTICGDRITTRYRVDDETTLELDFLISLGEGPNPRPIDARLVEMREGDTKDTLDCIHLGLFHLEGNTLAITIGVRPDVPRPRSLADVGEVMALAFTRVR